MVQDDKDQCPGSPSTDGGGNDVLSEKDLRRLEKERREQEKCLKADRERVEKLAKKEHDRMDKLAKKREKEEQKSKVKTKTTTTTTDQTSPSPVYADEIDDDRSPPVSPTGGVPMQTTIPAAYEHVTEDISAQASGAGVYVTNALPSSLSVHANGRSRDLVPVIPAGPTATPGDTLFKPGGTVRQLSPQIVSDTVHPFPSTTNQIALPASGWAKVFPKSPLVVKEKKFGKPGVRKIKQQISSVFSTASFEKVPNVEVVRETATVPVLTAEKAKYDVPGCTVCMDKLVGMRHGAKVCKSCEKFFSRYHGQEEVCTVT